MDPSKVKIPPIKNLSAETITENTILINSGNPDPRFKYVLERLVSHLHDFARETRLSTKEWMAGLEFLTATGKTCTDVRQVCHDSTFCVVRYVGLIISGIYSPFGCPWSLSLGRLNRSS
jgi:hypothetical protein